jgi:hypothetical protein
MSDFCNDYISLTLSANPVRAFAEVIATLAASPSRFPRRRTHSHALGIPINAVV